MFISDIEILNTLQWTEKLDDVWKTNKDNDEALTWQYIGTQSGVMRIYPGEPNLIILKTNCCFFHRWMQCRLHDSLYDVGLEPVCLWLDH